MKDESKDGKGREGVPSSRWFEDPEALLQDVQESGWSAVSLPHIAGYEGLEEIERGGQGVVYRAIQNSTSRQVAIKVLLDGSFASENERRRFEREVEVVAALRHPNIVRVYDSGVTSDDRLFYVMEYVEGSSLVEFLQAETEVDAPEITAPLPGVLSLFGRICDAVHFAHQQGVMHRDLKPGNIRVDPAGEPHILDFGLAKIADPEHGGDPSGLPMSRTGEFLGSLPWASPEQAEGAINKIDIRTDVYSLGVILYQIVTGRFPYRVVGPVREVLNRIVHDEPIRPSLLHQNVDDDLETILLKCLQKSPDRRYQSSGDVSLEINRYLAGEPIEAKRDSRWYLLKKAFGRHKGPAVAAIGGVFLLLAFGLTMSVLYSRALSAEKLAESSKQDALAAANKFAVVNEFLLGAFIPSTSDPEEGRALTVREGVDAAAERIEKDFAGKKAIQAELHLALGYWYGNLGMLERRDEHHLRTLTCRREALGDEHPDVANQLLTIGGSALNDGNFKLALQRFSEALKIQRNVVPGDDRATARMASFVGLALLRTDDPSGAVPFLQECLTLLEPLCDRDDPSLCYPQTVLGECYIHLGRLEEAERLLVKPYQVIEAAWGRDHGGTQDIIKRLVFLYETWEREDQASIYRERGI